MKYGVIADIHGNFAALRAAFRYFSKKVRIDKLLCLGDMIGSTRNDAACLHALMRVRHAHFVQGEHDLEVMRADQVELTQACVCFLEDIPHECVVDRHITLKHGSLSHDRNAVLTPLEISASLQMELHESPSGRVCFFGHTHIPLLCGRRKALITPRANVPYLLAPEESYLINPGSVGLPGDHDCMAAFGVYDSKAWTMTFVREPYDPYEKHDDGLDNPPGPEEPTPTGVPNPTSPPSFKAHARPEEAVVDWEDEDDGDLVGV